MALNRKIALLSFDKQNAQGTAAATKKWGIGLRGGSLMDVGMEQAFEELTIASRFPPSAYRSAFGYTIDVTTRAWPQSIVALLEGALGARSSSGTATPYTHTITPATAGTSVPLPWMTTWARLDTEFHRVTDCKVDELTFRWNRAEPLEVGLRFMGASWLGYQTVASPVVDDTGQQSLYPAGGTFQIATSGTAMATADITGGEIAIRNHLEPIRVSRSLEPTDYWPGLCEIGVTLRVIPTDTTLWRTAITGAAGGTVIANAPTYGSFRTIFAITAGTTEMDLYANRIAFAGDYPQPDPAGGPAEIELTGTVLTPTSGNEFYAVVKNNQAGTAYSGT